MLKISRNLVLMFMGAVVASAAAFALLYGEMGIPISDAKAPAPLPPQYLTAADLRPLLTEHAQLRADIKACTSRVAAVEERLAQTPASGAKSAPATTGSLAKKK